MKTEEILAIFDQADSLKDVEKYLEILPELGFSDKQITRLYERLSQRIYNVYSFYQKSAPLLYQFFQLVPSDEKRYFHTWLLQPMYALQLEKYLSYLSEKLNLNIEELTYLDAGAFNYGFAIQDYVIKLGTNRATFDFPVFYRMNDLIVQKKFAYKDNRKLYVEVSPKGRPIHLTYEDVAAINEDFASAGLVLQDQNIRSNFMLFEEDPILPAFQDIDGDHPFIDIPPSENYQKKKVKLIDLDFIYRKGQKHSNEIIMH